LRDNPSVRPISAQVDPPPRIWQIVKSAAFVHCLASGISAPPLPIVLLV
jgi:hypothetical protein